MLLSRLPSRVLGAATASARYVLRVQAELRDGRIYTLDRRLQACR